MRNWVGIALSGALLMTLSVGCSPTSRVASAGTSPSAASLSAVRLAAAAQASLGRADLVAALRDAEAAVALAPADAARRLLLGRVYMASGRFMSAEAAFTDALNLDSSLAQARLMQGLVQLAQGKEDAALIAFDAVKDSAPPAEAGLALALAGRHGEAVELLGQAVRAGGADARTRQNLAMALALAGRWNEAAATAHHDMTADQVIIRLQRWTRIAQMPAAARVRAVLGVEAVADAGQPAALALAPTVPTAPEVPAEVVAQAAPIESPSVAAVAPSVAEIARGRQALVRVDAVRPAAILFEKPPVRVVAAKAPLAVRRAASPVRVAAARGHYVVQLGAFASSGRLQAAWNRVNGKAAHLSGFTPASSDIRSSAHGATLYRLAIGGFESRAEAMRVCTALRSRGGACFVRATAGDRPLQWALRNGGVAA
jgi:Flp pilus assembly protein TadD